MLLTATKKCVESSEDWKLKGWRFRLRNHETYFANRALRKEGYTQDAIDHLFKAIVLPKFMYALPVYGASSSDVNLVQRFLARCYKRRYISDCIDINEILEKIDRKLFKKIKENATSPLHDMLPVTKESSRRLRRQTPLLPRVYTERFKNCFFLIE